MQVYGFGNVRAEIFVILIVMKQLVVICFAVFLIQKSFAQTRDEADAELVSSFRFTSLQVYKFTSLKFQVSVSSSHEKPTTSVYRAPYGYIRFLAIETGK